MTFQDTSVQEHIEAEVGEDTPSKALRRLAVESYEAAGGDWVKAAQGMRTVLDANPALFRELMEPLVDQAIWYQIRMVCASMRKAYGRPSNADNAQGLKSLAKTERQKWLDYPLSSGLKLRDADRVKLLEESEMHAGLAHGNDLKARFFASIAKRIDGKLVSEILTEKQLIALWEKVSC